MDIGHRNGICLNNKILYNELSTGWNSRWIGDCCFSYTYAPDVELGSLGHIITELIVCRNDTALASFFPGKIEPFYRNKCAAKAFRFCVAPKAATALRRQVRHLCCFCVHPSSNYALIVDSWSSRHQSWLEQLNRVFFFWPTEQVTAKLVERWRCESGSICKLNTGYFINTTVE